MDLSHADILKIKANNGSAYTEPFNNILFPLDPQQVEVDLLAFASEVLADIQVRARADYARMESCPHSSRSRLLRT